MRLLSIAAATVASALLFSSLAEAETAVPPSKTEPTAVASEAAGTSAPASPPAVQLKILNRNALPADMMPGAKDAVAAPPSAEANKTEPAKPPSGDHEARDTDATYASTPDVPANSDKAELPHADADAADSGPADGSSDPDAATKDAAKDTAAAKPAPPSTPTLTIDVDLTSQRMTVTENGAQKYFWPISSAREGYSTPTGTFRPSWMSKMWYSKQYDYAPMPHAIFFTGGTAIHATYATRMLGQPASHGCVRLSPANAATLYALVNRHSMALTRITVHGSPNYRGPSIARNRYRDAPGYAEAMPPRYRMAPDYAYPPGPTYSYRSIRGGRPVVVYRTYTTPPGYFSQPRRYVQRSYSYIDPY